ncbi:hypothetical protein [Bradyrhizobium sp. 2S1]|uniref:hypothetical protein n=1 Tax=Bradyrhizobium sp. 2S1 TaxID=1404429 RepID=UPI0014086216|nr:hypothetical protein [Bradyrhizobium sp. 2S1]MCK7665623.1 hypothetical protein [Bradyrhizobium sp. 2S1]
MQVDFSGVITNFDGVPPGGFFMFDLSTGGAFGLCVAVADDKRAIISLPGPRSRDKQFGWIQTDGLTQTFVYLPRAVLRPALSSAVQAGSAVGSFLICAGNKRFIRGYENAHYNRTFNVETGLAENDVAMHDAVYFTEWRVGHVTDGNFEQIYSFPVNVPRPQ